MARGHLDELLAELPGRSLGSIAVKLFELHHDGVRFGLIDETGDRPDDDGDEDDEFEGYVELRPDELGFSEPWDGNYET